MQFKGIRRAQKQRQILADLRKGRNLGFLASERQLWQLPHKQGSAQLCFGSSKPILVVDLCVSQAVPMLDFHFPELGQEGEGEETATQAVGGGGTGGCPLAGLLPELADSPASLP